MPAAHIDRDAGLIGCAATSLAVDDAGARAYAISAPCLICALGYRLLLWLATRSHGTPGFLSFPVHRRAPNQAASHALVSWSRRARQDRVVASPGRRFESPAVAPRK